MPFVQQSVCPRGVVIAHIGDSAQSPAEHERLSLLGFTSRLAALLGYEDRGLHAGAYQGRRYFVPSSTLTTAEAEQLGICAADDLFGGVVPHAFVATKAITHGLVSSAAVAVGGWNDLFARDVQDIVLAGHTVFDPDDARIAGARLLARGPVRIKPVRANAGLGQSVARDLASLEGMLRALDRNEIASHGLVLEEDLLEFRTFSAGQITVPPLTASYIGTQRQTRNNRGAKVFGGSDLTLVRGGFDDLLEEVTRPETRRAIEQAMRFHDAAHARYPGLYTSRANYDVLLGRDARGALRCGVLEQSWRVGGATGAERLASRYLAQAHHCQRTQPCISKESIPKPARSPNTQCSNPMTTRSDPIAISVDGKQLAGTLVRPDIMVPGMVLVHGWDGSQDEYVARAHEVASMGCTCLTFDLRGHVAHKADRDSVSREENLRDLLAAYDLLASQPGIDPSAIAVVGSSYGGYLAAILASMRRVRWLALRVPALYDDADWSIPKRRLDRGRLHALRRTELEPKDNRALAACSQFTGDALVVESEHDDFVPHQTIQNYVKALSRAQSVTYRVIAGADHGLSDKHWQQTYTALLVNWMDEMLLNARAGRTSPAAIAPKAASAQTTPED